MEVQIHTLYTMLVLIAKCKCYNSQLDVSMHIYWLVKINPVVFASITHFAFSTGPLDDF